MEIPKRVVRGGLTVAALGAFAEVLGCISQPNPADIPRTPTVTPAEKTITPILPTVTIVESAVSYPEIDLYYPQLRNYQEFGHGEFNTGYTSTKWFNFSRMNFDPDLATATFKFFEDLGRSQRLIGYPYGQQSIPFFLNERPRTERVLYLIPQETPPPNWPDIAYTASTTGQFTDGPYTTFVRIFNTDNDIPPSFVFTTAELSANKAFAVEACQSSLQVLSLTPDTAGLGQEIICNSWGPAFTLRQMRIGFRDYTTWAKDVLIRKDPFSPSYPLYVLNENEYDEIPVVGMAIHQ